MAGVESERVGPDSDPETVSGRCQLEVLVGTYEQFVVGYRLLDAEGSSAAGGGDDRFFRLQRSIAEHCHSASVRCMAAHRQLVATGAADHVVKVLDLRQRREVGLLMDHEATVTCLAFHGGGRLKLLSGDEEGRLLVSGVGSGWQCRQLGRHCAAITCLAVHPGGLVALSACHDRQLITWDLVRARVAYRTRLEAVASFVHWSLDGVTFAVGLAGRCDVYSVSDARVIHAITASSTVKKIICAVYVSERVLLTGGESGHGVFTDVSPVLQSECGAALAGEEWRMFDSRVRAACCVRRSDGQRWLAAGSSSGCVRIWCCDPDSLLSQPQLLASCNVGCRVTCMSVYCQVDDHSGVVSSAVEGASMDLDGSAGREVPVTEIGGEDASVDESDDDSIPERATVKSSQSSVFKKSLPRSKKVKKQYSRGENLNSTNVEETRSSEVPRSNEPGRMKKKNFKRLSPSETGNSPPSGGKFVTFVKRKNILKKTNGKFKSKQSATATNTTQIKRTKGVRNKMGKHQSSLSNGSFHSKKPS